MPECPGPLIWHDVPADDRFPALAGLLECGSCDFIIVTTNELDDRHRDVICIRADA